MKKFLGRILFSIVISILFFSSCQNRNKVTETTVTDTARRQWLELLALPAWTSTNQAGSQIESIDDELARMWLRRVIPLPKLIRFEGRLTLPATDIRLRLRSDATDVEQFARDELASLITEKTGATLLNGSFEILIGICNEQGKIDGVYIPGADKLSGLKNNDQAYVISPLSTSGLAVVGLTGQGVYYGVKTLQQLIKPGLSSSFVVAPILFVMDWPDLAERGRWGGWGKDSGSMMQNIHYMANRKMNLMETDENLAFDENGHGMVKIDTESRKQARLHAVNSVLIITHLDILGQYTEIYKRYPQAKGKGVGAISDDLVVPCASSPEFVKVLSEWLESAASQGVLDINIWLTEHGDMHCECDQCKDVSQYVLEAKACAKAWQIAHEKYPDLRIRILLTQGTYNVNDQILSAVPQPEIRITYYSGSWDRGTYTALREPIIYPLLTDFAKEGHWLGCYPTLSASFTYILPWCGPQFIKYRMTEFVDKGLTSFTGYVAYSNNNNSFYDFNLAAAAEWSWNVHGRSEHEFAASWATQHGVTDPETFADWAVMLGPVSWDVYGSQVPHIWWGSTKTMAMFNKREQPMLGQGMFQYFPTLQHLDNDLAVCGKALKLAEYLGDQAIIAETRTIQGYLKMIKAIYIIADMVAGKKDLDNGQTLSLQTVFSELQNAELQTIDALSAWFDAIDPDFDFPEFNPIVVTHQVVSDIAVSLAPLGIKK